MSFLLFSALVFFAVLSAKPSLYAKAGWRTTSDCAMGDFLTASANCKSKGYSLATSLRSQDLILKANINALCPPSGGTIYYFWVAAQSQTNGSFTWSFDGAPMDGPWAEPFAPKAYPRSAFIDPSASAYRSTYLTEFVRFNDMGSIIRFVPLCEYWECTDSDCYAHGTTRVNYGPRPGGEVVGCCSCHPNYVGANCSTRVCHVDYDCQSRGLFIHIGRNFPDCACHCQLGFGGRRCRTLTPSLSTTTSVSMSSTFTPTPTYSVSNSLPYSNSASASACSGSRSPSRSLSPSESHSRSSSQTCCTPSITPTVSSSRSSSLSSSGSRSSSPTVSPSLSRGSFSQTTTRNVSRSSSRSHSSSSSSTVSLTATSSESISITCRDLDDLLTSDTCSVLRPLTANDIPSIDGSTTALYVDANWLTRGRRTDAPAQRSAHPTENDGSDTDVGMFCTRLSLPFTEWSGRTGATHSITFVAVDFRVPLANSPSKALITEGSAKIESVSSTMELRKLSVVFETHELLEESVRRGHVLPPSASDTQGASRLCPPQRVEAEGTSPSTECQPGNDRENARNQSTAQYFSITTRMRYTGPLTLNKMFYSLKAEAWSRCPIPMPLEFHVTLVAANRLLPPIVAETRNVLGTSVALSGSLTVSPSAVLQGGISNMLKELSRCRKLDLDDANDDDNYEQFKPGGFLNPLGLSILAHDGGTGRALVRGAMLVGFVYVLFAMASLMAIALFETHFFARKMLKDDEALECKGDGGDNTKRKRSGREKVGECSDTVLGCTIRREGRAEEEEREGHDEVSWYTSIPSIIYTSTCLGLEGILASAGILGVTGYGWGDLAIGWCVFGLCAAYLVYLVGVCTVGFPSHELLCVPLIADIQIQKDSVTEGSASSQDKSMVSTDKKSRLDGNNRSLAENFKHKIAHVVAWMGTPTHAWEVKKGPSGRGERWRTRFIVFVSDHKKPWYGAFELCVAAAVTFLSSVSLLSDENAALLTGFCIARNSLCAVLVGAQLFVVLRLGVFLRPSQQIVTSAVLALQTVVALLSIANVPLQDPYLELTMDIGGFIVALILACVMVVDLWCLVPVWIARLRLLWRLLKQSLRDLLRRISRGGFVRRQAKCDGFFLNTASQRLIPPVVDLNDLDTTMLSEENNHRCSILSDSLVCTEEAEMMPLEGNCETAKFKTRSISEPSPTMNEDTVVREILRDFRLFEAGLAVDYMQREGRVIAEV